MSEGDADDVLTTASSPGSAPSTAVFMQINLLSLAAIAFVPFPTALVGSYSNRPWLIGKYVIPKDADDF